MHWIGLFFPALFHINIHATWPPLMHFNLRWLHVHLHKLYTAQRTLLMQQNPKTCWIIRLKAQYQNRIIGPFQVSSFVLRWPAITGQLYCDVLYLNRHIYILLYCLTVSHPLLSSPHLLSHFIFSSHLLSSPLTSLSPLPLVSSQSFPHLSSLLSPLFPLVASHSPSSHNPPFISCYLVYFPPFLLSKHFLPSPLLTSSSSFSFPLSHLSFPPLLFFISFSLPLSLSPFSQSSHMPSSRLVSSPLLISSHLLCSALLSFPFHSSHLVSFLSSRLIFFLCFSPILIASFLISSCTSFPPALISIILDLCLSPVSFHLSSSLHSPCLMFSPPHSLLSNIFPSLSPLHILSIFLSYSHLIYCHLILSLSSHPTLLFSHILSPPVSSPQASSLF